MTAPSPELENLARKLLTSPDWGILLDEEMEAHGIGIIAAALKAEREQEREAIAQWHESHAQTAQENRDKSIGDPVNDRYVGDFEEQRLFHEISVAAIRARGEP